MNTRSLSSLAAMAIVLVTGASALAAAPNLSVTITAPASTPVYESAGYTVKVTNIGNKHAYNVSLAIQLPVTHTSPQVYVLGTLGAFDSRCTRTGTVLNCALGTINKNNAFKNVPFDIALPYAVDPIVFTATASTAGDSNLANNTANKTAIQTYVPTSVAGPVLVFNRHCTGQNLTSFFECELFPSSLSGHDTQFGSDGGITFVDPIAPEFTGEWWQPTSSSLVFEYYEYGSLSATFTGVGVGGDCFEGETVFEGGGPYSAMYEVCLE